MKEEISKLLHKPEFPRSNGYDPGWVMDGAMGPNPLWLLEWLSDGLPLEKGMRICDLGCGKVTTSVFLAREFDAAVFALDLWTSVDENFSRIKEANESSRVIPMQVEAHSLPFAEGFFDALVSIDAYQYFGTDELYLQYASRFVRPGGLIGLVMPGLVRPFPDGAIPEHLTTPQASGKVFWEDECVVFHTAEWWADQVRRCSQVELVLADTQPDGWRHWRDFEIALERAGKNTFPSDAQALTEDAGQHIGFVRVIARRNEQTGYNLYEPLLELKVR